MQANFPVFTQNQARPDAEALARGLETRNVARLIANGREPDKPRRLRKIAETL